ncbi:MULTISPECIES: DUF4160 domain-containing protein [Gluconobacter]|uniref:DUF4160 domain-containing protein n=1 Tax=Gluconobacter oxydans NBRC 3293 TaxID=1315969 RepID=A0A829WUJ4_GLUOY|nr:MULTISPECIES: DUF4160 domain-containing protein [Gluconobacter]KXV16600.1 hypothetical protein AD932_01020 [Gluconobacter oxydans]KXV67018.1 hypothetical protein AD950_00530 [Gluconobacter oxydans]MBS1058158.1 DUF4160 domain-containing protein [Gluconobacter kondonii]MBS1061354.1 DUF4160 domain-containing protein [Gluconobacter sp. Dm-44]MBS1064276.1 DUF4160 domain-containing protein [Gluconobacter wancherniae]
MPTLLRINGFRVVIYTADHEPMHVHVINAEGEAVIVIGRKARLIRSGGMKDKSIQNALEIVQDNAGMLAEAWETIHGA